MSGTITLTAAMRANLLSLQQTGNQLSTTQLDLSTGNSVNSALDNPVNFFAAQSLNQRASSLSALLDGMGQSIQTIQAANQGITTLTSLVNQLTSIANSATQDLQNTQTQNVLESQAGLDSSSVADLVSGASAVTLGDSFSLQDGSGPAQTFTINTTASGGVGTSLTDLVSAINQVSGLSASIVYGDGTSTTELTTTAGATDDSQGDVNTPSASATSVGEAYLKVVSTDGQVITAANVTGTDVLGALGLVANNDYDTTTSAYDATTSFAVQTGGDAGDITSYASVIAQINQTVLDSNYQGNNLIDGSGNNLTVQVNELSQGAITVNNADLTATGNPATPGSTGLGLDPDANSWTSAAAIAATQTKIAAALTTLQTTATGFANSLSLIQTRQDFTTNLVNTLQNGASELTIADKNEEGANLLALQTQQQLGIEALSLSSQANQSVLRLFA